MSIGVFIMTHCHKWDKRDISTKSGSVLRGNLGLKLDCFWPLFLVLLFGCNAFWVGSYGLQLGYTTTAWGKCNFRCIIVSLLQSKLQNNKWIIYCHILSIFKFKTKKFIIWKQFQRPIKTYIPFMIIKRIIFFPKWNKTNLFQLMAVTKYKVLQAKV